MTNGGWDSDFVPDTESAPWLQPLPDSEAELPPGSASPDASYELRESVELAFTAALQHLPPNQRAALILREVLGFTAREVAEVMATSEASVKSALQRARATIDGRLPDRSQQATMRSLGDARIQAIVERYIEANERGDVTAMVDLLAEDAAWSMPPYSQWFSGRESIAELLRTAVMTHRWRHLPTAANAQPAIGCYRWHAGQGAFVADGIDLLTLRDDGRITAVTAFLDPDLFARFGLPEQLAADA